MTTRLYGGGTKTIVALLCLLAGPTPAQAQRDPTQPPAQAFPAPVVPGAVGGATAGAMPDSPPWGDDGIAVLIRDGKPYLVNGTRLYGVGQKLGAYRIERITETEVWLRNGKELRKLPRFAGIQRKVIAGSH